jgi:hypothetical protein
MPRRCARAASLRPSTPIRGRRGYSDHVSEADPADGAASMRSPFLTPRWSKADSNSESHPRATPPAATRFIADSALTQRRFELSVPPSTPAFRGAPHGPAHRSRFRSLAAVIVTLAALPILWTPNVVVARMVVGGFRVAFPGALLFAADGWIATGYVFVWQIALTKCRATRPRGSPGLAQTLAPLAGN